MRLPITIALVWLPILAGPTRGWGVDGSAGGHDFDSRVGPIVARRCLDCHSGINPKGKLDLGQRALALAGGKTGVAIVPGKPDESLLWERVESGEMPPNAPLPDAEKVALRQWIASGAVWGSDPIDPYQVTTGRRAGRDWWSLQPVRRVDPPRVLRNGWAKQPIDAFVLKKMEASGLSPAAEADRLALIRRLSFDLTGLPPTPDEVDTFVGDSAPGAYERLVDRYLASPQYGPRWARWWLDLARYGESNGFEYDEFRPNAWRYRDWVIGALNRDLPYDQFGRLQLAGDVLVPRDPGAIEATGFLVAGAYDTAGQNQQSAAMKAMVRGDELEDVIGTVGQTFLGLTLNCARCHDHKFDPVPQVEYYRLASAFGGVRHGERDLSEIDPDSIASRGRVQAHLERIGAIEAPVRRRLGSARKNPPPSAPVAVAAWDFDCGPDDRVGSLKLTLHGDAVWAPEGLRLDGKTGYAATSFLPRGLKAKTIEVWVRLERLDQRGGGAISVQTRDGSIFDAIVFAERELGRWMAGSDNFKRYRSVSGPIETDAASLPIQIAITYAEDGTIRVFRQGKPYGVPYKSSTAVAFPPGDTQVVFGLRHFPPGGDRMLQGTVVRARLYDRAVNPSELAASWGAFKDSVDLSVIIAALPARLREERSHLLDEVNKLRSAMTGRRRKAYAVSPRDAGIMRVQIRGNPQQLGEVVAPGGVSAIAGLRADFNLAADAPEAERRKRLASWICNAKNPLFARVLVNRLWQAHFGVGLVESPSDLGFNGGAPSHPELLDWLAAELVARGWSLKAMHRLIVSSAAYRQSSRASPSGRPRDAGNRLLWRKAPVRLEAEMVRDAMLAAAGQLDLKLNGPSFHDYRVIKSPGTPAVLYAAVSPDAGGLNRRTVFRAWARGGRSAFLDAFDCPDPSTTAPRRQVTTTPLQALSLLNNALVLHLADALAARLVRDVGSDPRNQVDWAYRLAFGRRPQPAEQREAIAVVERFGAATLARAIFNTNEFLYVD